MTSTLEERGVQISEQGQGLINHAVEYGDTGNKIGFESQLRTAKAIVDQGVVDPEDIKIEPDVDCGDVDILVEYENKSYQLQVKAKNFYDSNGFFPAAHNKVKEFYESIKDSSHNATYDILYESPEDIRAEATRLPSAPGSAARIQFSSGFYGQDRIQNKIRSTLRSASSQLRTREGPLQYNVAVVGTHSFPAAGDNTYYRLTLKELQENPGDYVNLDLILIQSLTLNVTRGTANVRLLPVRNPLIKPELDAHIFGDTKDVQLYRIRFAVFPYHISEPGAHTIGIKDGRLHVDGHTGTKII
ncbi:hypothetical protein [Haloferax elongans]|uniref:hypothetical protein n=1 Tax=Haloferax elongans TaxID=403191 RepID=UPI00135F142E|nr:hypothetical protein [Haloferax elongans]